MKVENNQQMLGQWTKLIRMQHPEKMLKFVRSFQDETLATLYGIPDTETFLRLKNSLQRQTKEAAAQLLEDPAFADRVDQLPFRQGETIVGLGESTTDDLLSWFEILRQLLELRRPWDGIRLVNEGLSGHTSSQLLGRINGTMAHDPDWVLCMIGGNDALRFGPEPSPTQVSIGETSRNLAEIRRLAQARGNPRWIWITPTTINGERVEAFPPFWQGGIGCHNEDIAAVGDVMRNLSDPVVDTQADFGLPANALWMEADGLHPSLAGHQIIVTLLVQELTGGK
ncbi:SGNH/GDSL hydrolase family protein [Cohnella phaseoli]|uniref:Acyl-CoA thioesterase-1 n=1 Tax=Cohnella phaseoli TaxID=456490 RepID=A0A3D9KMB5_9BACL|nr:GDSL-type esterase/lipase family protein [Cohnella phaseoli]RED87626.1 acyl-CoA thioesterase-1 [Cohnella phaseoli]